jgi:ABC-type Na+ efflux pump permease subunit
MHNGQQSWWRRWFPSRRAWLIAKRDYIASVRTKSFLIGLILFPMIFGGGALGVAIMKAKPDVRDRHVALLDRSEKLTPTSSTQCRVRTAPVRMQKPGFKRRLSM